MVATIAHPGIALGTSAPLDLYPEEEDEPEPNPLSLSMGIGADPSPVAEAIALSKSRTILCNPFKFSVRLLVIRYTYETAQSSKYARICIKRFNPSEIPSQITLTTQVYQYLRGHQQRTDDDWRSIQRLCKLKYWTRKWTIQELVMARTVVLRAGNAEFPMTDFETFCYQLRRADMNEQFQGLNTPAKRIWQTVNRSPASRLALQRLEAQRSNRPRTLYELVENNRDNQCQVHCDHVYALYSLAGEHRRYLNIDYAASPVQRLVDVLNFVTNHEQMPPAKVVSFANMLIRLLKVHNDDLRAGHALLQTLWLTIPATILGTAELRQETQTILKARKAIKPFGAMPIYTFSTDQATWSSIDNQQNHRNMSVAVGRQDMAHFSIAGTDLQGLAASTVNTGDIIWNFSGTKHVFVVRTSQNLRASIVGRAYLFQGAINNGNAAVFCDVGYAFGDYKFGEYDESAWEEEKGG
ncbi:hypothetical protein CBER1_09380 [Cercospora berteroae]|uniref:Heterokaryon incompatibility domain-containing protein n=1 Tax=Cercospora berteroae TaxID=357750 RepID=A0A2S6C918_9PEZI|nr:hypothetical protein CBER1_09380 [Cercospora berteroae]